MQNQLRDLQAALRQETFGSHHLAWLQTAGLPRGFTQCQYRNYTLYLALHPCFLLHRTVAQFERHSFQSRRGVAQVFRLDHFPFNHTAIAVQPSITRQQARRQVPLQVLLQVPLQARPWPPVSRSHR
jgi:hypothetical protein